MRILTSLLLLLGLLTVALLFETTPISAAHSAEPVQKITATNSWPHVIPLRVRDGANRNLMAMT
jgi:hypothetical protein